MNDHLRPSRARCSPAEPAKTKEAKSKHSGKEAGSKSLGDRWEARQPSLLIKCVVGSKLQVKFASFQGTRPLVDALDILPFSSTFSLFYSFRPNAAAQGGKKIAAFDLDGTMVVVKGKAPFPKDAGDWKFFNKSVPRVIHEYADQGYQIVIFSNQGIIKHALTGAGSEKTRARVDNVLAGLTMKEKHIEAQVFLATSDDSFRKPMSGMWELFVEEFNGGVKPDLKSSFYCGDMAGRQGDVMKNDQPSATDKCGVRRAICQLDVGISRPEACRARCSKLAFRLAAGSLLKLSASSSRRLRRCLGEQRRRNAAPSTAGVCCFFPTIVSFVMQGGRRQERVCPKGLDWPQHRAGGRIQPAGRLVPQQCVEAVPGSAATACSTLVHAPSTFSPSDGENFKASAFDKVHNILAAYPSKITAAKELNKVAGVGKSSLSKVGPAKRFAPGRSSVPLFTCPHAHNPRRLTSF